MFGHGQMKDRGGCLVGDALHNSNLGPGGPSPAARSVASPICMQLASLRGKGGCSPWGRLRLPASLPPPLAASRQVCRTQPGGLPSPRSRTPGSGGRPGMTLDSRPLSLQTETPFALSLFHTHTLSHANKKTQVCLAVATRNDVFPSGPAPLGAWEFWIG